MPTVGLLILAAGASTRLGIDRPKQLLPYQGRSLLRHAAETALASQCRPIVVVLGAHAERFQPEVADLPVTTTIAERWEQGMGASIQAGIAALILDTGSLDGVVISLCDQPLLSADHINALLSASVATPDVLVASEYDGTLGVPALFPRTLFPDLQALPETHGAKPLLQRHAAQAMRVPFPAGTRDIDTLIDYQNLISETDEE